MLFEGPLHLNPDIPAPCAGGGRSPDWAPGAWSTTGGWARSWRQRWRRTTSRCWRRSCGGGAARAPHDAPGTMHSWHPVAPAWPLLAHGCHSISARTRACRSTDAASCFRLAMSTLRGQLRRLACSCQVRVLCCAEPPTAWHDDTAAQVLQAQSGRRATAIHNTSYDCALHCRAAEAWISHGAVAGTASHRKALRSGSRMCGGRCLPSALPPAGGAACDRQQPAALRTMGSSPARRRPSFQSAAWPCTASSGGGPAAQVYQVYPDSGSSAPEIAQ